MTLKSRSGLLRGRIIPGTGRDIPGPARGLPGRRVVRSPAPSIRVKIVSWSPQPPALWLIGWLAL